MFARFFELPVMDDDPVLFDGPPEWLVPGLASAMRQAEQDGLGLRSLIERAEVPPRPWPTAGRSRSGRRGTRVRARERARGLARQSQSSEHFHLGSAAETRGE